MPTRIASSIHLVLFVGHRSSLNQNEETFLESKFRLYWTRSRERYWCIADILRTASVKREEALWWAPAGFHGNLCLCVSIFNIIASQCAPGRFQRTGNDWTTKSDVRSSSSLGNLTLRGAVGRFLNVGVHQEQVRLGRRFVDICAFNWEETNLLVTEALVSDLWSFTRKNQISSRRIISYLTSKERKRLSSRLNVLQNLFIHIFVIRLGKYTSSHRWIHRRMLLTPLDKGNQLRKRISFAVRASPSCVDLAK